jgi:hypothetical protein
VYVLVVVLIAVFFLGFASGSTADKAEVRTEGKVILTLDLNEDSVHTLYIDKALRYEKYEVGDKCEEIAAYNLSYPNDIYHFLVVVIEDGYIFVEDADCYDRICVLHGKKNKSGANITCAPFKIFINVTVGKLTDEKRPELIS